MGEPATPGADRGHCSGILVNINSLKGSSGCESGKQEGRP
jgi:hypothetical protein